MIQQFDKRLQEEKDNRQNIAQGVEEKIDRLQKQIDEIVHRDKEFKKGLQAQSKESAYEYFPNCDGFNYFYEDSKFKCDFEQGQYNEARMMTFK